MMSLFRPAALTVAALLASAAAAQNLPDTSKLSSILNGTTPDAIAETPVPGLYEVVIGSQVLYLTEDGRFVIQGEIVDLETTQNLTENRLKALRADALAQVNTDDMIVYPPPQGDSRYAVTVFTDIDCGYCRKLHQEMSTYHDQGIEVRYLAFPRAGLQSESYTKAVSAWCADDPQQAMTVSKQGGSVPALTCENPVSSHFQLGQQLGVRGTPSIFLSNGDMVPGYVPAERLAQMLDSIAAQ